ncbi:MAG: hypothetical protein KGY54_04855 [Oleiphilaceae bacterium]|nr:hypothetical protein [Oleiphilaceae bacterium]
MRRFQLMLVSVLAAGGLIGCGQKGPLYREPPVQEAPEQQTQDQQDANADRQQGDSDSR